MAEAKQAISSDADECIIFCYGVDYYLTSEADNGITFNIQEGDNLSLAIGKKGQNVKLAARLTKCKIDVKTREQVQEEVQETQQSSEDIEKLVEERANTRTWVS